MWDRDDENDNTLLLSEAKVHKSNRSRQIPMDLKVKTEMGRLDKKGELELNDGRWNLALSRRLVPGCFERKGLELTGKDSMRECREKARWDKAKKSKEMMGMAKAMEDTCCLEKKKEYSRH